MVDLGFMNSPLNTAGASFPGGPLSQIGVNTQGQKIQQKAQAVSTIPSASLTSPISPAPIKTPGGMSGASLFAKPMPTIQMPSPVQSGIGGLNAPTIGSSFATPAGATQTQANQMPTSVQQNIGSDISSNKTPDISNNLSTPTPITTTTPNITDKISQDDYNLLSPAGQAFVNLAEKRSYLANQIRQSDTTIPSTVTDDQLVNDYIQQKGSDFFQADLNTLNTGKITKSDQMVFNKSVADKNDFQTFITPMVRFLKGVADVGAGIGDFIGRVTNTTSEKDIQSGHAFDEAMAQNLLGKKAGAEKYIEGAGQLAGVTALTAPVGMAAAAGVGGILGTATTIGGGIARGALAGGITGLGGTELGSIGIRGRNATPAQLAVGTAIGGVIGGTVGGIQTARALAPQNVQNKITEAITPKMGASEAKSAIIQGRATSAQGGVFGGDADVIPSDNVQRATDVINTQIESPSTDPAKLYGQMDDFIGQKATELRGPLSNMSLGDDMTAAKQDIVDTVQKQIIDNPAMSNLIPSSQIKATQGALEALQKSQTAEDLWNARISLDLATPQNVKNATETSTDILQMRQSVWLDVRSQMNQMLDNVVSQNGSIDIKNTFADMSSLYNAQQNILTKATQILKPVPGWINLKQLRNWALGLGIGAAGLGGLKNIFNGL